MQIAVRIYPIHAVGSQSHGECSWPTLRFAGLGVAEVSRSGALSLSLSLSLISIVVSMYPQQTTKTTSPYHSTYTHTYHSLYLKCNGRTLKLLSVHSKRHLASCGTYKRDRGATPGIVLYRSAAFTACPSTSPPPWHQSCS